MRTRTSVVAAALLAVAAMTADIAAARPAAHRLRVSRVIDLLRGEPQDEWADWALVAFDGPDAVVGVWSTASRERESAIVWRRADVRTGALSRTTRVEFPGRVGQSLDFDQLRDGLVVGQDGVATVRVRHLGYRDETFDRFGHLDSVILQFSREGELIARLSIAAPAEIGGPTNHVKLVAHDGVVDVAFSAQLTRDGDRAVWWRRIAGGAFLGDPVRLSAPAESSDPVVRVGIWNIFLGVDPDGVGRVLYRRVTFRGEPGEARVEPPELFWTQISPDGVASESVSLGVRDVERIEAAFAPNGAACVMRTPNDGFDGARGTSFLEPLLVSPSGALVEPAGPVVPQLVDFVAEERLAVGADEDSVFHLGSIAASPYRGRIGPAKTGRFVEPGPVVSTMRRVPSAVFVASLGADGEVRREVSGVRLGMGSYGPTTRLVAADGTIAVAGLGRSSVSAVFVSPRGACAGRISFPLTPGRVQDFSPVLASIGSGDSLRFAVAWSSHIWGSGPPSRRVPARLRVAVVE